MLDFETFLYKGIGARIKNYREKKLGVTQDELIAKIKTDHYVSIDNSRLSAIENGKVHKKKNPYLLTDSQIEGFLEIFNCEKKELIFGKYNDREESVKIFLLAIVMNSEKDKGDEDVVPFMDFLFRHKNSPELKKYINYKSNKNKNGTMTLKNIYASRIMNGLNEIEKTHPFFTSERICKKYQSLIGVPSLEIELISNLLIKLLMGDLEFTKYYILRMNSLCEISGSNEVVYSFIENKGMLGGALINNKNNFSVFANAFEKMWSRHKDLFVEFFEEHLFNKIIDPEFKLKEINNRLFNNLITDTVFSNLIYSDIEKDRFSIETMDGHFLYYQHLLNRYVDKEIENSINHPN